MERVAASVVATAAGPGGRDDEGDLAVRALRTPRAVAASATTATATATATCGLPRWNATPIPPPLRSSAGQPCHGTAAPLRRSFACSSCSSPTASQPLLERCWPYLLVSPPRYFPAAHVVYTPERERAERLVWEQLERLGRDAGDFGLTFACFYPPAEAVGLEAEVHRQRQRLDSVGTSADLHAQLDATQGGGVDRVPASLATPAQLRRDRSGEPTGAEPVDAGENVFALLGHGGTGNTTCLLGSASKLLDISKWILDISNVNPKSKRKSKIQPFLPFFQKKTKISETTQLF